MSRSNKINLPFVVQADSNALYLFIGRVYKMKPAEDIVDVFIDRSRCLKNLFNSRMRTSGSNNKAGWRLNGQREFPQFQCAGCLRDRRYQIDIRSDLRQAIDVLEMSALPWRA